MSEEATPADFGELSRAEVLQVFKEAGAILQGHFQLTSGRHSDTYLEKFRVLQSPKHTEGLCRLIAARFRDEGIDLVAGPTTGGIILAYEVGRQLGVRGIFAEGDGRRIFKRGFHIEPGERVLVVDDILTTGGSVREALSAVREAGGQPVGVAVLVDRTGGGADFGLPFHACLTLEIASYEAADCPLCAEHVPLTKT